MRRPHSLPSNMNAIRVPVTFYIGILGFSLSHFVKLPDNPTNGLLNH